jgi:hypothetical protein
LGFLHGTGTLPSGETFPQFFNNHFKSGDLYQAKFANDSQLGNITLAGAVTTILIGTYQTDVQIAQCITDAQPGGVTTNGVQYITWADESTSSATQLLNGYIKDNDVVVLLSGGGMDAVTTSCTVQTPAHFGTTNNFFILIDSELMEVTNANGGVAPWTVSRNFDGKGAAIHAQGTNVEMVQCLNGALTSNTTTVNLQTSVFGTFNIYDSSGTFLGVNQTFAIQIDSEIMTVTAGWGTTSYTVTRNAAGTVGGAVAHADKAIVKIVWNDPGIIAFTNQCHASNVKTMFSPLGLTIRSLVLTTPSLVSTPDILLYESQRLANDSTYISEVQADCVNFRNASGGKPLVVQLDAYDFANANAPRTRQQLISLIEQHAAVTQPEYITLEYLGSSTNVFYDVMRFFRP